MSRAERAARLEWRMRFSEAHSVAAMRLRSAEGVPMGSARSPLDLPGSWCTLAAAASVASSCARVVL